MLSLFQREEEKLKKLKQREFIFFRYNHAVGSSLMYLLPVVLVILIINAYVHPMARLPVLLVFGAWCAYTINVIVIFLGVSLTRRSFLCEQRVNRMRGLPFDSLHGFESLENALNISLFKIEIITIIAAVSLGTYLGMLLINNITLGYAGLGMVLIAFGLAILTRAVNYSNSEVSGLINVYEPQTHPSYLDFIFTDIATTFMDPVTFSKFDEYTEGLKNSLNEGVDVVTAREKLFYCLYLYSNSTITEDILRRELLELIDEKHYEDLINNHEYFDKEVLLKIIDKMQESIPQFSKIIDRLQFDLVDNLSVFKEKEVYFDVSTKSITNERIADMFILLYNNSPDSKNFKIRVLSPNFEPSEMEYNITLTGKGGFDIKVAQLPISSEGEEDVIGCMSRILDLGDMIWITLLPKSTGTSMINVFLEDENGHVVQGISLMIKVKKDIFRGLKKITGGSSMGGGILIPLVKLVPMVTHLKQFSP